MLYAPRMRFTPGYSSGPMSINATPWKGICAFSSAICTHTQLSFKYVLSFQLLQMFVDAVSSFLRWRINTVQRGNSSSFACLLSTSFPSGPISLAISTGHSLFSLILCRSLKLQSTPHFHICFCISTTVLSTSFCVHFHSLHVSKSTE